MVGVDVEPRPRRAHRANEVDRGHAAGVPARRGDAAGDPVAPVHALERPVGRVEQPHHVRPRRDRAQPAPLVRLVPDRPVAHPRVAARGRDGEVREVGAARRRDLPRAAAVRPARRSEQGDDGADPAPPQAGEHVVGQAPVVGRVPGQARARRSLLRDLVPADRPADDVHAEPVERVEAVVERAGPVDEPGVVLDAEAGLRRRLRRRSSRERQCEHDEECEFSHSTTVSTRRKGRVRIVYERCSAALRACAAAPTPRASLRRLTRGTARTAANQT